MLRIGLCLSAVVAIAACSADDGGVSRDAAADAPDDAAGPLTFETQTTDLATDTALVSVVVTEVGTQNTATSAPNGRAVLMVPFDAPSRVSHALAGYLTNTTQVDPEPLRRHNDANVALKSDIITETELDTIYSGLAVVRDDQTTQLLLYVRSDSLGPATGVEVTVTGAGQSFVRGPGGDFEAGTAIGSDALILIPNVVGTSATVSLSASCPGPQTVPLIAGELASAFYVCDPSL